MGNVKFFTVATVDNEDGTLGLVGIVEGKQEGMTAAVMGADVEFVQADSEDEALAMVFGEAFTG